MNSVSFAILAADIVWNNLVRSHTYTLIMDIGVPETVGTVNVLPVPPMTLDRAG